MKICIISFWFIFFTANVFSQKRIALVIGNADYDANAKLKNPVNDAALIASDLRACHFQVIQKSDLDKRGMIKAIDSFSRKIKRSPSAIALFYYSGHGLQHGGENYIIPLHSLIETDADPDLEIKNECVQISDILSAMQRSGSAMNIIILDACRDDPMSRSWKRGIGEKGLAVMSSVSDNTFIIYSTSPGRVAEDGAGKNSVFTEVLAKHILDPGIYIEEVFKRTKNDVVKLNSKQIPWSSSSLGEDFSFSNEKPSANSEHYSENKIEKTTTDVIITSPDNYSIILNGDTIGIITENNPSVNLDLAAGDFYIKAVSNQSPGKIIADTLHITKEDLQKGTTKFLRLTGNDPEVEIKNNAASNENKQLADVLNKIKYNMVQIRGGEFKMGDKMGYNDATPEHNVKLNSFYISKTEVTQEEWTAIMGGEDPSYFTVDCKYCPVENVSWNDANEFIHALDSITNENYSLPTEAQWEYAATGGDAKSKYYFSGGNKLSTFGWYRDNSINETHPVGLKATNENGIYDMSGNVAEWCSDWYDENYYNKIVAGITNPKGPTEGMYKVVRGGGWDSNEMFCKIKTRFKYPPSTKKSSIGFRLVKEQKD
ncbi:MAG TPA: SUMF1/EgtB/PvdO family nonheme iron enzyme [Puia sp.]|nr:SUMF1/EgtB/PvdO family nonheme iron enzyme [Puia sp.]